MREGARESEGAVYGKSEKTRFARCVRMLAAPTLAALLGLALSGVFAASGAASPTIVVGGTRLSGAGDVVEDGSVVFDGDHTLTLRDAHIAARPASNGFITGTACIYSDTALDVVLEGESVLDASAIDGYRESYGIYVTDGDLRVSGSGTLAVRTAAASRRSICLGVENAGLYLDGSESLELSAGQAAESFGAYATGDVSVAGVTLKASGNAARRGTAAGIDAYRVELVDADVHASATGAGGTAGVLAGDAVDISGSAVVDAEALGSGASGYGIDTGRAGSGSTGRLSVAAGAHLVACGAKRALDADVGGDGAKTAFVGKSASASDKAWNGDSPLGDASSGYRFVQLPGPFTVTFRAEGGHIEGASGADEGSELVVRTGRNYRLAGAVPSATREGYRLAGWEREGRDEGPREDIAGVVYDADTVWKAVWHAQEYTIRYHLAGGRLWHGNPERYTVESDDIALHAPKRTGYLFAGWTGSNGADPAKDVVIARETTGDLEYTANWTALDGTARQAAPAPAVQTGDAFDLPLAVLALVMALVAAFAVLRRVGAPKR